MRWLRRLARSAGASLHSHLGRFAVRICGSARAPERLRRRAALFAQRAPLRGTPLRTGISVERLLSLVADPASRQLLQGDFPADVTAVISLIEAEDLVPLGTEAILNSSADSGERSTSLYQAIVLDRATTSRSAMRASLLAVATIAHRLQGTHQRSIFERCLTLIRTPIDPYQPANLILAARQATVALLLSDIELRESLVKELGAGGEVEPLRDVIGAALRSGDLAEPADLLAEVIETWTPGEEQAISLGQLCNTGYSTADPVFPSAASSHPVQTHPRTSWFVRHVIPVLSGPAICLFLFGLGKVDTDLPNGLEIGVGGALGALALLLGAHVVSAQLAAERLPGSLARFSSQPLWVAAGYSSGFSLVAAALLAQGFKDSPLWPRVATIEMIAFGFSLAATLISLLRKTDATEAAIGLARDQVRRFERAGKRMGKIQKQSGAATALLDALPWARTGGTDPLSERRAPIRSPSNGFFVVDAACLRRLDSRPAWGSRDLLLHVSGGIGTLVQRDQSLAWIIPARGVVPSMRDRRLAERAFSTSSERRIEQAAETLSVLVRLAGNLAGEGNPGGANRVADALTALLASHLGACQDARGDSGMEELEELFPVNLALRSVLIEAARAIGSAAGQIEREVYVRIVARALRLSRHGDAAVTMAVNALPSGKENPLSYDQVDVIWEAGLRALHLDGPHTAGFIDDDLRRRIAADGNDVDKLIEVAARLTMAQIWINQLAADSRWEWFLDVTDPKPSSDQRRIGVIRIGAVALLAGCFSVAVRVGLQMRGENIDKLRDYLKRRTVSAQESFLSHNYGHLLGGDPEEAMVDFLAFAERLQAVVPVPAPENARA